MKEAPRLKRFAVSTVVVYAFLMLVQYATIGLDLSSLADLDSMPATPAAHVGVGKAPPAAHDSGKTDGSARHLQGRGERSAQKTPGAANIDSSPQQLPSSAAAGAGNGGSSSATLESDAGIDNDRSATAGGCGLLPAFGSSFIQHPKREIVPWVSDEYSGLPELRVSFEPDRILDSPLSGMTFDTSSVLYIFLTGPTSALFDAQVTFNLNHRRPWLSSSGVPFDLMGMAAHKTAHGLEALPLHTSSLGRPACHMLEASVKFANGSEFNTVAQFQTIDRPPVVWLITTVSVNDYVLLGFFLGKYLKFGVHPNNFVITVHSHSESEAADVERTVALLRRHKITRIHRWVGPFNTFDKFELQESFGRRFVLQKDWVMHPDVDEHHNYPGDDLLSYVARCDEQGVTAVFGDMQDRVASNGRLVEVEHDKPLETQFPLECDLTHAVVNGATTKVALHRGFLIAEEGGYHTLYEWKGSYGRNHLKVHSPPNRLTISHFKWTASVENKLRRREREFKKQGIRWWVQSSRLLQFVNKANGVLNISSPTLNCIPAPPLPTEKEAWPSIVFGRHRLRKEDTFTVILMAYSPHRRKNQETLLKFFANLDDVHEVIFLWNGVAADMPNIPTNTLTNVRVRQERINSLNNRWNHTLYPKTDAVLMMDDDEFLPLLSIRSLFARWRHEPDRLVGAVGRMFIGREYMYPKNCCQKYSELAALCPNNTAGETGCQLDALAVPGDRHSMDNFCDTFRMVLPKGMFFHRKYLRLYTHWHHRKLRKYVDEQAAHCDDVAFNFLVANVSGLSAVVLDEDIIELEGSNAGLFNGSSIASKQLRNQDRSDCVQWISRYFGGNEPKPFAIESAGFHLRQERHTRNPVVRAHRRYSVLWEMMGKCLAHNGKNPR